jgi:GNAT superfamily N-acetyltransferase
MPKLFSDPFALQASDAEAVAALIRAAFSALGAPVDPAPSALKETAESIAAAMAEGGGAGIRAGETLAGVVVWSEREGGLYVGRLSVHPDFRGRGIARALLETAEQAGRAAGLPRLHLATRLALAGNRALFAATGFSETGLHTHPGYAAPTYVSMEKKLV